MKSICLSVLRDKNAPLEAYRQAADQLATLLAVEADALLPKQAVSIATPLESTQGEKLLHPPILVPILRSGIVLLHSFLRFYPSAPVGFIGMKRDEQTAIPKHYYTNLPPLTPKSSLFLLDPMIATGGSASLAVDILKQADAAEGNITLISFLASPEGMEHFKHHCPNANLLVAHIDKGLNAQKWIIPGLGDFGDRYFGTD